MNNDDHIIGIIEASHIILEESKNIIRGQHPSQEYEAARDKLNEEASALKTILDAYEDKEDQYKKQKRAIDDKLSDLKIAKRPIKAQYDDTKEWSKRANNSFWDAKRSTQ